jgi:hypothetical protein
LLHPFSSTPDHLCKVLKTKYVLIYLNYNFNFFALTFLEKQTKCYRAFNFVKTDADVTEPKKARIKIFKVKNEEARVHFIPTLKDGVFVTLCAPLVIKYIM